MVIKFFTQLFVEDDGQGLVEHTPLVLLVALVFWIGVKNTDVGDHLASGWSKVLDCITGPFVCSSSS